MSDVDETKPFADARTRIRDAVRWIVTVLGSAIVLIVGGGLIADIPALGTERALLACVILFALIALCGVPLNAALKILASEFRSFQHMATSPDYEEARARIDPYLKEQFPPEIDSVTKLYAKRAELFKVENSDAHHNDRLQARIELKRLGPKVRLVLEMCSVQNLEIRYERFIRHTRATVALVALLLAALLFTVHNETANERLLAKPIILKPAWSASIEGALEQAGMRRECFSGANPHLIQVSELSGLRSGLLAVPAVDSFDCQPVRLIMTNEGRFYSAN